MPLPHADAVRFKKRVVAMPLCFAHVDMNQRGLGIILENVLSCWYDFDKGSRGQTPQRDFSTVESEY